MRTSRHIARLAFAATILLSGEFIAADVVIDNYSSAVNDRFQSADAPDQFFVPFDLSGVGQDASGRWATLIGPNTIISANHFAPSGSISFYPDNTNTTAAIQIAITSDAQRIGSTDLWLATARSTCTTQYSRFRLCDRLDFRPSCTIWPWKQLSLQGSQCVHDRSLPGRVSHHARPSIRH